MISTTTRAFRLGFGLLTIWFSTGIARAADHQFDVVVYGGTPAGITAAVGAAREGAKVAIVEPLPILGGIMSSGLSFSDSNQTDRESLRGLFEEIHLRIEADYQKRGVKLPYEVAVKDQRPWTYEPHVAEQVFHDLVREAGVQVFLGQWLTSSTVEAHRLQQFTTQKGETFRAKVFVDASYEGDLLPAAKVRYTSGRESKQQYGEALAGQQFSKKPMALSPPLAAGEVLPLMTAREAGPDKGDGRVMTYSFRLCVAEDAARKVPFPKPANYDPAQYELVRRYLAANPKARMLMDFYPLPGGKTDVNNSIGGQISLGLVGQSSAWIEADWPQRQVIFNAHKNYTLGLIWFLNNDPSVPANLRAEMQRWGLAKDEFTAFDNWPPVLYVREGRRMIGEYVLTQSDVRTNVAKADSVGISSFPIDSHDCQRVATPEGGFINEGTIFPERIAARKIGQPHQVPYRSLTPRRSECENLLVPVALSASHVAYSSIRVEPTWMMLGQSAGVAAALAAQKKLAVQDLPYAELRTRLLAQKQVLDLHEIKPLPVTNKPAGN